MVNTGNKAKSLMLFPFHLAGGRNKNTQNLPFPLYNHKINPRGMNSPNCSLTKEVKKVPVTVQSPVMTK